MVDVHAALAILLIFVVAAFTLAAVGVTVWSIPASWLDGARLAVTTVLGIQVTVGVVLYAGGDRPGETLHLLYGIAALAVIPLAAVFAAEAPPRGRAGTLAVGGVLTLLLLWRSWTTG